MSPSQAPVAERNRATPQAGAEEAARSLRKRLADLRRRLWLVAAFQGVCWAIAVLVGSVALACLIDQAVYLRTGRDLPALIRALVLVGIVSGSAVVAYRFLFRPLSARTDDLSLALRVEEQYPELNDALASTIQFLQQSEVAPGISSALQREAVQRTVRLAQGCDFNKVINTRGTLPALVALAVAAVLVVPLLFWQPGLTAASLLRLVDPFGGHLWPGQGQQTRLQVTFPPRIGFGQRFTVKGKATGVIPATATIEFQNLSPSPQDFKITRNKEGTQGTLNAAIDMTQQRGDFKFRVRANDATSPPGENTWHTVELRHPPALARYPKPSPQLVVHSPHYTDLPTPTRLAPGNGNVEGVPGTHVQLVAATDRPITRAWIEYKPTAAGTIEGSRLAPLGARGPLEAVALAAGGYAVWGRTEGTIKGGKEFAIDFQPWTLGTYALTIEDAEGLAQTYEYDSRIVPDPAPTVTFVRPSGDQSVLPNAELTVRVLAEDDVYAVRSVYLEYRRQGKDGRFRDEGPQRLAMYDHAATGSAIPQVLGALAKQPLPVPAGADLRLRLKRVQAQVRWPLAGLVEEGDTLLVQACALDFNDVSPFPNPGRSAVIRLTVVGRKELLRTVDDGQAKLEQELVKLREMQEQAIGKLIRPEQQWRQTGKLRPEDVVQVAESEQIQKQINERIGQKPDEGLRGELARLQDTLKENKLPQSATSERLKAMKDELDRLAREHLPEIEPRLTNARRELENKPDAKPPAPKAKGDLDRAREHQEEIKRSLDDLHKFLDDWADVQQIRGKLRQIADKQREIQQETEKLELDTRKQDGKKPQPKGAREERKLTPEDETKLRELASRQKRLANQTQNLLDQMNRVAEKRDLKDPRSAEMLRKAAKIGSDDKDEGHRLVGEMRDSARQLHDEKGDIKEPQLNRAIKQQEESIKALERMLEAMDQGRDAELERLAAKQKKGNEALKKLGDDLERLRRKIDKARKIEDPKEREAELKKLAEEQRDLEAEAEKQARELARLQAPRAGEALKGAGQKMDRAAKRLEQGLDPEEDIKEAQKQVEQARQELQDVQERTQEELAREQLARIADRLKGLKERQDAALAESVRLHKRMLQKGKWDDLLESLADHHTTQAGLGKETGSLKEKLKGAPVFELVLEKAVKAMDKAAQGITKRRESAGRRQVRLGPAAPPLGKDELAAEDKAEKATEKLQEEASRRLQRLIDAIKPELEARRQPKKQPDNKVEGKKPDPKNNGEKKAKGGLPGDGVPPLAQLKVLRGEQQEVNERTREFAEQHPDPKQLNEAQRTELESIRQDQERISELFQRMAAAVAGAPEGKAGNGGNNP
ncbi:MAG: hypothetical protein L0Z62_41610 [Gemmataceae bacterium]|nr:hypothetical protein [Gemmataceae bacterium]